jgi:hypothetical protein
MRYMLTPDFKLKYDELVAAVNELTDANAIWMAELLKEYPVTNPLHREVQTNVAYRALQEKVFSSLPLSAPSKQEGFRDAVNVILFYVVQTKQVYTDLTKSSVGKASKDAEGKVKIAREKLSERLGEALTLLATPVRVPSSKTTNLFLKLLIKQQRGETDIVTQTRQLFDGGETLTLTDAEIIALLGAWDRVVKKFIDNPFTDLHLPSTSSASAGSKGTKRSSEDTIKVIISFTEIHSLLEVLYNGLTTNVERTSEESLDSLLFGLY